MSDSTVSADDITLKASKKVSREDCDYMLGREIENTPAKGMQTLFIAKAGLPPTVIAKICPTFCTHIYFGANKCFPKHKMNNDEWRYWERTIEIFLKQGYYCTLDIPVHQWNDVLETSLVEYPNFILMLSLELPYINQAGYHATLKLDDTSLGGVNGGVWCHQLHDLRDRKVYTAWNDYRGDKTFKLLPPSQDNEKKQ